MKGMCDSIPTTYVVESNNLYQVWYNFQEVSMNDRVQYSFDYVEITIVDRGHIIDAIISEQYTKDAEIALINNELASPGTKEYADYQNYRTFAKSVADVVLA